VPSPLNGGLATVPAPAGFWTEPGSSVAALRRAHGDLFRLNFPAAQTVNCAVGEAAHKTVLIDHQDRLSNYDPLIRMGFMPPATAGGLITMDPGAEHRWFRKVLTPPFSSASIASHLPLIHEIVSRRLRSWPRDGVIDLYAETAAIAFHVTSMFTLGKTPTDDVAGLLETYRDLTA
jgi:cytochrome P450